jgi:hypothetical protein
MGLSMQLLQVVSRGDRHKDDGTSPTLEHGMIEYHRYIPQGGLRQGLRINPSASSPQRYTCLGLGLGGVGGKGFLRSHRPDDP